MEPDMPLAVTRNPAHRDTPGTTGHLAAPRSAKPDQAEQPTRFLRYPGGKSKFLDFLAAHMPNRDDMAGRYIEPFLGSGAVFFHLKPRNAVLSDLNGELIELFETIRTYPYLVWQMFDSFPMGRDAYYAIRRRKESSDVANVYRAARTLYLNRTCFKGMWRQGPTGDFNVGYGGEARRWAISRDDIIEVSESLRHAKILQSDFERVLELAVDGDFLFLDPPYKPGERH